MAEFWLQGGAQGELRGLVCAPITSKPSWHLLIAWVMARSTWLHPMCWQRVASRSHLSLDTQPGWGETPQSQDPRGLDPHCLQSYRGPESAGGSGSDAAAAVPGSACGVGWQQGETEAHPGIHRKEEQVACQHGSPAGASLRSRTLRQLCPGLLFAVSWSQSHVSHAGRDSGHKSTFPLQVVLAVSAGNQLVPPACRH